MKKTQPYKRSDLPWGGRGNIVLNYLSASEIWPDIERWSLGDYFITPLAGHWTIWILKLLLDMQVKN